MEKRHWLTRLSILAPYAWLVAFFLVPFLIILKISLSQTAMAQPPYEPLFDLSAGWEGLKAFFAGLSLDSYAGIFADPLYVWSYWKSLQIAAISTAILLLTGYPVAYAMARAPRRWQGVLVLLVVLPLYAALERMDETLLEAAADLGAPPWRAFARVTVPLSRPGIVAGCLLCFIPITGEFVIPDLLGSSSTAMIGQVLWLEFFGNRDWPVASALAVVLLVLLVTPITIYRQREARQLERS